MHTRHVIRLQLDVPLVVKLDSKPEGREKDGRYGVDYEYIVNDDRNVLYLPRDARDQLVRCGAQPGDEVQIVKSMRGRASIFSVQVVPESDAAETPAPATRSNGAAAPSQPNNNGRAAATQARPDALPRPGADMVAGYLYCAIDAAMAASVYAKERHGWPLQFDAEQVRRLAITLMIGAREEGRL